MHGPIIVAKQLDLVLQRPEAALKSRALVSLLLTASMPLQGPLRVLREDLEGQVRARGHHANSRGDSKGTDGWNTSDIEFTKTSWGLPRQGLEELVQLGHCPTRPPRRLSAHIEGLLIGIDGGEPSRDLALGLSRLRTLGLALGVAVLAALGDREQPMRQFQVRSDHVSLCQPLLVLLQFNDELFSALGMEAQSRLFDRQIAPAVSAPPRVCQLDAGERLALAQALPCSGEDLGGEVVLADLGMPGEAVATPLGPDAPRIDDPEDASLPVGGEVHRHVPLALRAMLTRCKRLCPIGE